MKFNCGRERIPAVIERAKHLWHTWFAWYPVRVGRNDCRWLETVHRKGTKQNYYDQDGETSYWTWEYKP